MKRTAQLAFVVLIAIATLGSDASQQRFDKIGHRLMCSCGCNQVLLECNHVGCPVSDGMRNELKAAMNQTSSEDAVLDVFVKKYGPVILAAPTMTGFNRVAWIMPYLALALGLALTAFIVRNWRHRPLAAVAGEAPEDEAMRDYRRRVHEDTQL